MTCISIRPIWVFDIRREVQWTQVILVFQKSYRHKSCCCHEFKKNKSQSLGLIFPSDIWNRKIFEIEEDIWNRKKRRNLEIITSMLVDVIQLAETLKEHMNAIAIPDMFTLILWVLSYRRKNAVTLTNVPKQYMNATLMPLATTMTEATLVHVTLDMRISMVMDEFVKTSMNVLLKLTSAMR